MNGGRGSRLTLVAVVLAWLPVGPAALAESATEVELKELAKDLPQTHVRVIGLPTGASEWSFLEKPFWSETVPELSGGRITTTINSMSELGLQGADVFRLVRMGVADIADIVANYGAGEVPELDGLDLAGVAQDFDTEHEILQAYAPVYREVLSEEYGVISLGEGVSTAQVFWCRPPIESIDDLRGKKIRLTSATLADLVTGLGGTPVTMVFSEAVPALQRGVIDCMITGTASGNTGGLFEVAGHVYPLVAGWAPRIRIANEAWFEGLDPELRTWLEKATDYYFREVSDPVERRNNEQGILCSVGDDGCTLAGPDGLMTKANMQLGAVSDADRARLKAVVEEHVLPNFAAACGPACTERWNETVGAVAGVTAEAP